MVNDKDIYTMFNGVEINIEEYKKEELTDIEKRKLKSNIRSRIKKQSNKSYYKYTAAACAVIVGIGLLGTDAGASAINKAEVIGNRISYLLGVEKDLEDYSTVVGKAVKDKGITVQLNEVILDGDELIVSSNVIMDEKISGENMPFADMNIYIDGKLASSGAGGGIGRLDDYTTESIMKYTLDDSDLKGDIDIKIVCNSVSIGTKRIKGKWVFNFKTNGDELMKDTKVLEVNHAINLPDGSVYTLDKYTDNSVGQKIYASIEKKNNKTNYGVELEGYDNLGNKVVFSLIYSDKERGVFEIQTIFGNIGEGAEYLLLTPFASRYPEEGGKVGDPEVTGEEFKIDLTKLK